jgi:hypothetical protein
MIEVTEIDERRRESRLRGRLRSQGFALQKCRSRTVELPDYGGYRIVDPAYNTVVAYGHGNYGLSLDDVEEWLG